MRTFACFTLCLLVLVYLGRVQEMFLFLVPLQLGKVGILLGLLCVLAAVPRNLLSFLLDTPWGRCVLLLFAFGVVGIPFSVWPGNSLDTCISFSRRMLMMSLMVGLAMYCGIRMLRFSCALAVGIMALLMILEKSMGRASIGGQYDPNDIALLFIVFLPIVIVEAMHEGKIWRPLAWGIAVLMVMGIALTGSRGGIVALAAVGLHVLFAIKTRRWLLIPLLAIGVGLTFVMAESSLWDRFSTLTDESDYNFADKDGRLVMWGHGIRFMMSNPLLGVGIGQFGTAIHMYGFGRGLTAHNSFIQIGAELGLPGLIVFIAILRFIYQLSKKGAGADFLSKADQRRFWVLRFSLTGFCVGGFFLSQAYGGILCTFMALAATMFLELQTAERKALAMEQEDDFMEDVSVEAVSAGPSATPESPPPVGVLSRAQREALLSQGDTHALRRKSQMSQDRNGGEVL